MIATNRSSHDPVVGAGTGPVGVEFDKTEFALDEQDAESADAEALASFFRCRLRVALGTSEHATGFKCESQQM